LLFGAAAAAAVAVTGWIGPSDDGVPLCPSKIVFGIDCPLCGATRAVGALARGHVGNALDHNVVFTVAVPFMVVLWAIWAVRSWNHRPFPRIPWNRTATLATAAFLLAFLVVRNLEATAWMHWLGADLA
jgi:hypothetical protein